MTFVSFDFDGALSPVRGLWALADETDRVRSRRDHSAGAFSRIPRGPAGDRFRFRAEGARLRSSLDNGIGVLEARQASVVAESGYTQGDTAGLARARELLARLAETEAFVANASKDLMLADSMSVATLSAGAVWLSWLVGFASSTDFDPIVVGLQREFDGPSYPELEQLLTWNGSLSVHEMLDQLDLSEGLTWQELQAAVASLADRVVEALKDGTDPAIAGIPVPLTPDVEIGKRYGYLW